MIMKKSKPRTGSIQEVYKQPKKTKRKGEGGGGGGDTPAPHVDANHSKKPISEEISSLMYMFQSHKLETKE